MNTEIEQLEQVLRDLGEHWENIQVFCNRIGEDGDTERLAMGSGNFYARMGHVRDWLDYEIEATCAQARKSQENEEL